MKIYSYKSRKMTQDSSRANSSRNDTVIILLCGLAVFIVVMTLRFSGANPLVAFNFFTVTVSILLVPVSLLAKNIRLVRTIALVSLTLVIAAAFVNPPWNV
jgi:hypothetical protein